MNVTTKGSTGKTIDLALTAQERSEHRLALRRNVTGLKMKMPHGSVRVPRGAQDETGGTGGSAPPAEGSDDRGDRARTPGGGRVMGDVVYLGLTAGFFVLTWALIRLCERL
jgi:hypothetical protein